MTICPLPLPKSDYGLIGISSAVIPETCIIINEVFNISLLTAWLLINNELTKYFRNFSVVCGDFVRLFVEILFGRLWKFCTSLEKVEWFLL